MTDTTKGLVAGQKALAAALAAQRKAIDGILWMAERYAEGGGSRGQEMEDYRAAVAVFEASPTALGERILERLRLAEDVCKTWESSPYETLKADTQSAYFRWKRFMDQEEEGQTT
jgi:hypothetical protein